MTRYTTSDLSRKSGDIIAEALRKPVTITQRKKDRLVLLSVEEYPPARRPRRNPHRRHARRPCRTRTLPHSGKRSKPMRRTVTNRDVRRLADGRGHTISVSVGARGGQGRNRGTQISAGRGRRAHSGCRRRGFADPLSDHHASTCAGAVRGGNPRHGEAASGAGWKAAPLDHSGRIQSGRDRPFVLSRSEPPLGYFSRAFFQPLLQQFILPAIRGASGSSPKLSLVRGALYGDGQLPKARFQFTAKRGIQNLSAAAV